MKARRLFSFQLAVLLCVCIFSHAQVALPDSLPADTTGYGTFQSGDEIVFEEELPDGESMTDENGWDAALPGLYSSGNNVVGSIASQFGVSALGAATGTISFRLPAGVGGLLPSTGIGYNSQSGNGVAGVGGSITGCLPSHVHPEQYGMIIRQRASTILQRMLSFLTAYV